MTDDMIRNKREARGAIKLSGGNNQPPLDVDQLKLRDVTSDCAEESSERGSDTSTVQKLAESLSVIVETLNSALKGKSKRKKKEKKSQWAQDSSTASCRAHRRMGRAIASRGRSLRKQEDPLKSPRGMAKAKAKLEKKSQKQKKRPHMLRERSDWTPCEVVPQCKM